MEPDRPRFENLAASGEDSRELSGEGVPPRVIEVARSTTEGDLEGSRVLGFRTEKKVDDGRRLRRYQDIGAALPENSYKLHVGNLTTRNRICTEPRGIVKTWDGLLS